MYISPKAAIKESPIHGRGLFAVAPFSEGDIVCIKGGEIFDRQTRAALDRSLESSEIQIADDMFIGPLAVEHRERSMIFSNHSCDPNIGVQGQIVFVAMRDIAAGEELTHDWATTDDDSYELDCRCGAEHCRRFITGKDWKRKDLQKKYRGYFSWYLQEKIDNLTKTAADPKR